MKKPYVIICNDDGIRSKGLKALYDALAPIAEVLVTAPDSERSGASHSISVSGLIRVKKRPYYGAEAFAVSGTPADCAKIALFNLAKRKPCLFISGVNHGPNMSQFILYSGTVGAAAEAALLGIPALAFSIDTYEPQDMAFTVKYIRHIAMSVLAGKIRIKNNTMLNINLPDKKEAAIRGVKILPKGFREYDEKYLKKGKTKDGAYYFWHIIGKKIKRSKDRTDADAMGKGYITVSSLSFDLNDREAMKRLKVEDFRI